MVIVNGHGGNLNSLCEIARDLRQKGIFISFVHWWCISRNFFPNLFKLEERKHAYAEETALTLALKPQAVQMKAARDEMLRKYLAQKVGFTIPLDLADQTESGVLGVSTTASVDKGRRVLEAITEDLASYLNHVRKIKIEQLINRPKL